uniref:Protein FAM214B n=1 Tax=Anthurium amnicola TaxID=1678845 RepID=A0A1D1Y581_9ARAE
MGLPQVSSKLADEVTTSPSTVVPIPSQFGGDRTADLDGLHTERTDNIIRGNFSCSSIGDCQKKTAIELSKSSDGFHKEKIIIDGPVNLHKLKIDSVDKNCWFPTSVRRNTHSPVLRVVGFESSGSASLVNGYQRVSSDTACPSVTSGASDRSVDSPGLQLRKRLLSPLSATVGQNTFRGELLNLAGGCDQVDSSILIEGGNFFTSQDSKKANIGINDGSQPPKRALYRCSKLSDTLDNDASRPIFTDGSLLEMKEPRHAVESSPYKEMGKVNSFAGALKISPRKLNSPPLAFSPLGPKCPVRMKTAESCGCISNKFQGDQLILNNAEKPLHDGISEILFASEDQFRMTNDTFKDFCFVRNDLDSFIPRSCSHIGENCGPESTSAPQCIKFVRSLGGLPVRRSLIGSFEESLLSGRFSSSSDNKRLDGFLAVLNVTGGNFSPPSRKLPFSVISVDGDSSLLYYASIDLAGNMPSNKCKVPKMRRSLSNEDSRASKCRLRIPMKGCIQLELHHGRLS